MRNSPKGSLSMRVAYLQPSQNDLGKMFSLNQKQTSLTHTHTHVSPVTSHESLAGCSHASPALRLLLILRNKPTPHFFFILCALSILHGTKDLALATRGRYTGTEIFRFRKT